MGLDETSQAWGTWMSHPSTPCFRSLIQVHRACESHPSTPCLRCLLQVHRACDVSSKYIVLAMSHPSTLCLRCLIQVHRACDVSSKYTVLAKSHPSTPCLRCLDMSKDILLQERKDSVPCIMVES